MISSSPRMSALVAFFAGDGTVSAFEMDEAGTVSKGSIGSQAMADIALATYNNCNCRQEENCKCPKPAGWIILGEGVSRRAYLAPDGVVYKVQTSDRWGNCNSDEYKTFLKVSPYLPSNIRLAECAVYGAKVNAMEFAGNESPGAESFPLIKELKRISREIGGGSYYDGINDLHDGNVRMVNGVLVAIDYAL